MQILDVGCGKKKIEPSAVGIDKIPGEAVDIVWDLDRTPWPVTESSFDVIYVSHIIEHVANVMDFMSEVYRVAKADADIFVVTPHFSSHNSYVDPTHCRHLSIASFEYFSGREFATFYGSPFRFDIVRAELTFGGNLILDGIGRWLARRNATWYERHAAWVFPALDVKCHLKARKGS